MDLIEVRRQALGGATERRSFTLRVDDAADGGRMFRGVASVTGVEYPVFDWAGAFREMVEPGAFRATLAEDPTVVLNVNHQGLPLASTKATPPTLRLWEDDEGLQVEARLLAGFPQIDQMAAGIARGDISEMSFAFRVNADRWDGDLRRITTVNLHRGDVSIVTYGANVHTSTGMRGNMATSGLLVTDPATLGNAGTWTRQQPEPEPVDMAAMDAEAARFAAEIADAEGRADGLDDDADEEARIVAAIAAAQRRVPVLAPG